MYVWDLSSVFDFSIRLDIQYWHFALKIVSFPAHNCGGDALGKCLEEIL